MFSGCPVSYENWLIKKYTYKSEIHTYSRQNAQSLLCVLLLFWFFSFSFLEAFSTLPSCQNNNRRTLALNCSCTKTTFDQIILFRGVLSVRRTILQMANFERGRMPPLQAVPRGVFKAVLIHTGGGMRPGRGWGAFPLPAASLRVSQVPVALSAEGAEHPRTAFHGSRLQLHADSATHDGIV